MRGSKPDARPVFLSYPRKEMKTDGSILSVPVRAVVHHVRIVRQPAKVWVTTVKMSCYRAMARRNSQNYAFMSAQKTDSYELQNSAAAFLRPVVLALFFFLLVIMNQPT